MKRIYVLLIGVILSIGLSAQLANLPLKIQEIRNDSKVRSVKVLRGIADNLKDFRNLDPMSLIQKLPDLKNAIVKQKLDSIVTQLYDTLHFVWKPDYTEKFTYDSKGKTVSDITYTWSNTTNRLEPEYKIEYSFNTNGYITAYHSFDWDTIAMVPQWVEKYKTLYTYNAGNKVTEAISYSWDTDAAALIAGSKTQYTYNSHGDVLIQTSYSWDPDTSSWQLGSKTENTYDTNYNLIKSDFSYSMGGTDWMLFFRYEYNYNAQGKVTQKITSQLDFMTQTMVYSSKETYTYNAGGDKTLVVNYKWDSTLSAWVNNWKDEYTYDSNHRMLTYKEYEWNKVTSAWKPTEMEEDTYDTNGNLTSSITSKGDASGNWVKDTKMEVTINNTYNASDLLFPYSYGSSVTDYFAKMITGYTDYNWRNGQWVYDDKATFYYSPITITSTGNIGEAIFLIYPNPAKEYLNIFSNSNQPNEISLFNLVGNMVLQKQFNDHIIIPVGNLPSGVYIVKVTSPGSQVHVERVVLK
jgi:hypothetical protein